MEFPIKIWKQYPHKPEELIDEIAQELDILYPVSRIMANRGVDNVEGAKLFIDTSLSKLSPYTFSEAKIAVERIKRALLNKEKVLIYGDYDVDGITSVAIMYDLLKKLGASVEYHLPDRISEGYGMNKSVVKRYIDEGIKVIITVDCGISNFNEIELAQENNVDVIVTDHHEPGDEFPPALAIINPKIEGHSDVEHLAGVGVAFKLAQALCMELNIPKFENVYAGDYLDFVALGTVADIVPLVKENRILVKHGLKMLENSWRPGIRALLKEIGIEGKRITAGTVGYVLAPRLNAAGRIANPKDAVRLLLSEDDFLAKELACNLNTENIKRQEIEKDIFQQADEKIKNEINLDYEKFIVVAGTNWHPGVIGIVASKIVEKYHRPTIIISLEGSEGKGSARSIEGFDMYKGLSRCSELLLKYGGHKQAAGLSVHKNNISQLRSNLNQIAKELLTERDLIPKIKIDAQIEIEEIDEKLLMQLEQLEPFGMGNPSPVLAITGAEVTSWSLLGDTQQHLKLHLKNFCKPNCGIGFNIGKQFSNLLATNNRISLAFSLEKNSWNGSESLQLKVKDIKPYINKDEININEEKWSNFYDRRNINWKTTYLKNNIAEGDIIYFHDSKIAASLEQELLVENCEGMFQSVIANQPYNNQENQASNMFFYNFPIHSEDLRRLTAANTNIGNIHLLYNAKDCYNLEDLKEQKFPSRKAIGIIYKALKSLAEKNSYVEVGSREIKEKLNGLKDIGEEEVLLALVILSQIKLLKWQYNKDKDLNEIYFLAEPTDKKSLFDSKTYSKMMERRNQLEAWYSFLMYASLDEIVNIYDGGKQDV